MPGKEIRILSTRPLEASLIKTAEQNGLHIDTISFISTEPLIDSVTSRQVRELGSRRLVAAFTSMNAVAAVASLLDQEAAQRMSWRIFCIGAATRQSAEAAFGEQCITGTALSASGLATEILRQRPDLWSIDPQQDSKSAGIPDPTLESPAVVFFCGDQRRDELPQRLRSEGIGVEEVVVYQSRQTPHKCDVAYDGVVFFSPSAVNSFFSVNPISEATVLFAIGETTAAAIRTWSENEMVISASPEKEGMIRQVIRRFGEGT